MTAVHRIGNGPIPYCTDADKVEVPQIDVTGITPSLDVTSLTLTLEVAWQVGGAVDNCRIAVFSPKGLIKKAEHTLGDGGHFDAPASGTEVFQFQIDPDEAGIFYAVIYASQTEEQGEMNRSREPKSVLQRGAAETIRPEARDDHGVWLTPWGWDHTVTYPVARYAAQEQQYESPADGYLLPGYAALAPQSVHLEYMWGSLSSKKLAIFFYVGHGHPNELDLLGTRAMVLRGGEGQDVPGQVRHVGNLPDGALDRMALVVLLSCASYRADETGARLPDSFIDKGADTVVSFDTDDHGEGQLYIEHANYWARAFWTYLMGGAIPGQPMSVEAAATAAVEAVRAAVEHEPPELPPAGRDNYGNVTRRHVERVQSDTPLRPARWGR